MTHQLSIRAVELSDLERLCSLYIELNPDDQPVAQHEAPSLFENLQKYKGSNIFVGRLDRMMITSCTLIVIPNLTRRGRPYGLIENVVTLSNYRGQGFGKLVIKHAVQHAWEQNCYKVMLMTGSNKPGTLKFYEACGFEQSKTGFQIRNGLISNDRNSS